MFTLPFLIIWAITHVAWPWILLGRKNNGSWNSPTRKNTSGSFLSGYKQFVLAAMQENHFVSKKNNVPGHWPVILEQGTENANGMLLPSTWKEVLIPTKNPNSWSTPPSGFALE